MPLRQFYSSTISLVSAHKSSRAPTCSPERSKLKFTCQISWKARLRIMLGSLQTRRRGEHPALSLRVLHQSLPLQVPFQRCWRAPQKKAAARLLSGPRWVSAGGTRFVWIEIVTEVWPTQKWNKLSDVFGFFCLYIHLVMGCAVTKCVPL